MSSARDVGSISLIDVGARVYSRTRRTIDDYPLGGLVVEVVTSGVTDDGEPIRAFRTLAHAGAAPPIEHRISLDEVDRETISPASSYEVSRLLRRLCGVLADRKRAKKLLDGRELQIVRDIVRLADVLWPAA